MLSFDTDALHPHPREDTSHFQITNGILQNPAAAASGFEPGLTRLQFDPNSVINDTWRPPTLRIELRPSRGKSSDRDVARFLDKAVWAPVFFGPGNQILRRGD
jgi:hypothetical protein